MGCIVGYIGTEAEDWDKEQYNCFDRIHEEVRTVIHEMGGLSLHEQKVVLKYWKKGPDKNETIAPLSLCKTQAFRLGWSIKLYVFCKQLERDVHNTATRHQAE